jgi:multidrug resistance efflux pump
VAATEARLAQTTRTLNRLRPLREAPAVSQREFEDEESAQQVAHADLKGARARLLTRVRESSRLDVIDADRLALITQAQNADAARALIEAQANVFRAPGGGWQVSSSH